MGRGRNDQQVLAMDSFKWCEVVNRWFTGGYVAEDEIVQLATMNMFDFCEQFRSAVRECVVTFCQLLPRCYMPHNIYALQRAADYLMACGTDWLAGPSPLKVGWGVTAGRCGNSWIMCTDGDYINQKAVNVNQGKLNISYKEGDENERT